MQNRQHNEFMARAIQLAKKGQYTTHPNPRVGCVIVKNNQIIAEGYHERAGEGHAEVNALANAGIEAKGATAYVTLEPCSHFGRTPPCANALIDAGVRSVVIAMQDPNPTVSSTGVERLKQSGIDVVTGILEDEARAINPGFIQRMERQRPFVRVKMATSLDGRTALATGESQWITSQPARHDVQFWRAKSDAILTGISTVLADNPSLNVRLSADELTIKQPVRQPLRVILDSKLQCPPDTKLLGLAGKTLIYTLSSNITTIRRLESVGAEVVSLEGDATNLLPLEKVMADLAAREINEVHTEAGAILCGSLLQAQLCDELLLYLAPHLLGSDSLGAFHLPMLQKMQDRIDLKIEDIRAIGADWRIIASLTQSQV